MIARAVIGANFGDEGKGLVVDHLCATQGAGVVVRFNGGAQAGHTVVLPDGRRHVFKHFGAGTFCGVPTFLSQFFICNPLACLYEVRELVALGVEPVLYAHPNCLVTTFADMIINQRLENARGDKRHGSVGAGINETVTRSSLDALKITMSDLWNGARIEDKLAEICGKYAVFRTGKPIDVDGGWIGEFVAKCAEFADRVLPLGIAQCVDPVFEGAQGLLLDQDNKQFYPHLTRSNTGMKNVRFLCAQAGINDVETYYVSRTYLTRHGAGPLPGEDPELRYDDATNTDHPYQGKLRFAPLDKSGLYSRITADFGDPCAKLVLTHCDQRKAPCAASIYSYGPTRNDLRGTVDTRRISA